MCTFCWYYHYYDFICIQQHHTAEWWAKGLTQVERAELVQCLYLHIIGIGVKQDRQANDIDHGESSFF
jgi:hypothetical protein